MYNEGYLCDTHEREVTSLRQQVDHLERENSDLEYRLRQKESRVHELEDTLDSMRRELRYADGDHHLARAKRHGKNAIGNFW